MPRVIAGMAKGQHLTVPKGTAIRPTSDLIRGAIFSMLASAGADMSRVLDLYAGAGTLGIEALSRGAGLADFVEQNHRCCAAIRENLEKTGLAAQAKVHCSPVERAISFLEGPYSVVLMDPPYADEAIASTVERIAGSGLVHVGSTIVVEHSRRVELADGYGAFQRTVLRRHGDTCLSIYR